MKTNFVDILTSECSYCVGHDTIQSWKLTQINDSI